MTYEDILYRFNAAKESKRAAIERMQQRLLDEDFCMRVRQQKSLLQYGNAGHSANKNYLSIILRDDNPNRKEIIEEFQTAYDALAKKPNQEGFRKFPLTQIGH